MQRHKRNPYIDSNEYMSFGLSKDDAKSDMINADAVVTWVSPNGNGRAVDYFLGSKEQVSYQIFYNYLQLVFAKSMRFSCEGNFVLILLGLGPYKQNNI